MFKLILTLKKADGTEFVFDLCDNYRFFKTTPTVEAVFVGANGDDKINIVNVESNFDLDILKTVDSASELFMFLANIEVFVFFADSNMWGDRYIKEKLVMYDAIFNSKDICNNKKAPDIYHVKQWFDLLSISAIIFLEPLDATRMLLVRHDPFDYLKYISYAIDEAGYDMYDLLNEDTDLWKMLVTIMHEVPESCRLIMPKLMAVVEKLKGKEKKALTGVISMLAPIISMVGITDEYVDKIIKEVPKKYDLSVFLKALFSNRYANILDVLGSYQTVISGIKILFEKEVILDFINVKEMYFLLDHVLHVAHDGTIHDKYLKATRYTIFKSTPFWKECYYGVSSKTTG